MDLGMIGLGRMGANLSTRLVGADHRVVGLTWTARRCEESQGWGESEPVERIRPLLETLAPSPDRGWGHVGPSGAGHFVKMIHNGIEYPRCTFSSLDRSHEVRLSVAPLLHMASANRV